MPTRYSDQEPLYGCVVAREGATTLAGTAAGDNFIDAGLIGAGANSFVSMLAVLYPGDPQNVDSKDITAFDNVTGRVTLAGPYKGEAAAIPAGISYKIVTFRFVPAEVAALTAMVEANQYYDRIFYDSVTGIAGTAWPVGTPQVPSDVIADVITMCAARNLSRIDVHGILQLGDIMEHYTFFGHCHESITDVLDLNGQDVDNSRFDNCLITGAQGGTGLATYMACIIYNMTGFRGMAENCALYTPLAVSAGVSDLDHCTSLHGMLTVTVGAPTRLSFKKFSGGMILTAQTGGVALVRGISGYLEVDLMTGGTLDIYADAADIQINANCDAPSVINIYGNARVTIIGAPTATIHDYSKETQLDDIEGKVDAGFLAGAKDATVAKEATVDAGFLAGAKDATVAKEASLAALAQDATVAKEATVDAGFLAGAKDATVAKEATVDAGFLAGAKDATVAKEATSALIKAQTDKIAGKMLFSMDFWSLPQEEVALTVGAGDKALPSVTVADLPDAATIVRAIAMFKFRMVENHTYAGENMLDGAQEIQVAGAVDAINFVDTQFTLAEATREGGDVVIGVIDIAGTVNANGAYAFHWDLAKALQTGINFNDVQMGIRIWYSV